MRMLVPAAVLAATLTSVLGIAIAGPASAGGSCDRAPEIRAAFEPRLDYEQERAERAAAADDNWPAEIRRDFDKIDNHGLDCRAVYDRYNEFVGGVIARNDDRETAASATRGLIFKKW